MRNQPIGRAPDYTNAFLAMAFVWLMFALIGIWMAWGFPMTLVACSFFHAWLAHRLKRMRQGEGVKV